MNALIVRTLIRALLPIALVAAGCSSPSASAPPAGPASGSTASPSGGDTAGGSAATCGGRATPAGFTCASTPAGPTLVLASDAPADLDPCPVATCPSGSRCETAEQQLGAATRRLPHCVPTATAPAPSGPPTLDPCGRYLCPAGYHCTAPADAPYCVPDNSNW